jgi:hypothetical protein
MLRHPEQSEPHIKLLIIDMVNFYLELFSEQDRKGLITELHEKELFLDAQLHNKMPYFQESFINKTQDLEFRTLRQIN